MDAPPDFSGFDGPILDLEVIESLRELGGAEDPGLVQELIEVFLEDALEHLEAMSCALEEEDLEVMTRSAHTLKSSSAHVGAVLLGQVCKNMETAARERDLEGYRSMVDVCKDAYADFERAMRELT